MNNTFIISSSMAIINIFMSQFLQVKPNFYFDRLLWRPLCFSVYMIWGYRHAGFIFKLVFWSLILTHTSPYRVRFMCTDFWFIHPKIGKFRDILLYTVSSIYWLYSTIPFPIFPHCGNHRALNVPVSCHVINILFYFILFLLCFIKW